MSTKEMKALVRESSSEGKQQRNSEMKKEGLERGGLTLLAITEILSGLSLTSSRVPLIEKQRSQPGFKVPNAMVGYVFSAWCASSDCCGHRTVFEDLLCLSQLFAH